MIAKAYSLLSEYDLFCFPKIYHREGTSGSLIEAMIAGTPVLVSSYSQVFHLVKDGVTGYIFEIGNVESLINKLKNILENKNVLERIGKNAQTLAKKYTFEFNKANFLYLIVGE